MALRIAIVSQYFPPEPGATQHRVGVFAEGLALRGHDVTVISERPNHPAGFFQVGFRRRELSSQRTIAALARAKRWLYRASSWVTATTRPFCAHIDRVAGRPLSVHVPNGALDELIALPPAPPPSGTSVVGHTGNLGIAQGLGIVFDAAERLRGENVRFLLVGDGPLSVELRAERDRRRLGRSRSARRSP
jgi:glycosyltransferase involved in cell wall biosynthesis